MKGAWLWSPQEAERPAGGNGDASLAPRIVLGGMVLAWAAVFAWLSLLRHAAFQSHAFDLGNMDQAVWNTLHGSLLRFTDMDVGGSSLTTRLAIHVEPLLVPLSLAYVVHAGPQTLLVIQAVVVATGAVPAYLLAAEALGMPWASLVFPLAYLAHPSLQNAVLDDFHAVTLSAAFLMWALYAVWRRATPHFWVSALLAMSTKEEIGLLVAAMGIALVLRRQPISGVLAILLGTGWTLVCLLIIIPHFSPSGHSPYVDRYAYLGHGVGGMALGALRHPVTVLRTLTSPGRLAYIVDLLHPLGYVSLLAVPVLLLALPSLLLNMLSADPHMFSGFYQYSAEIVPFVLAAAAVGVGAVARVAGRERTAGGQYLAPVLCVLLLAASVVDTVRYGFSPIAAGFVVPSAGQHQRLEDRILATVPATAVVAAADEIEPHLSDRRTVYLLPTVHPRNGPRADWIVLDASIPSLPVTPSTLHRIAVDALRHGYGTVAAQDGILLLHRGAPRRRLGARFLTFAFDAPRGAAPVRARWSHLTLLGVSIHPHNGEINRSRPAIGLETYWRRSGPLAPGVRIAFYVSPVYRGSHPEFSSTWLRSGDSPTWTWLPLPRWPLDRTVHAASLPLVPETQTWGRVDVGVGVSGDGPVRGVVHGTTIAQNVIRVGTIAVDY